MLFSIWTKKVITALIFANCFILEAEVMYLFKLCNTLVNVYVDLVVFMRIAGTS